MNYQITRATVATCSFHKFKILTSKQCRCAIGLMFFKTDQLVGKLVFLRHIQHP